MTETNQLLYFDYNATSPVDERVINAMFPFLATDFANASSVHDFGLKVKKSVEVARGKIARLIGCEQNEIVLTGGSTEAINMALKGVAVKLASKGKHIVTVDTEHSAVIDTCKYLEARGFEVTYLTVDSSGLIDLNELKAALRTDTILVCVMYVNNETGVIQSVHEIAKLAHGVGALYLCDATQAIGKIPVDVKALEIDLLCLSGHKFYGPKGIGALYIRQYPEPLNLPALIHGGGHENGFRSGTLNVPSIVALGAACEIAKAEMYRDAQRISVLRDRLESELLKISGSFVNGDCRSRIFNTTNICFPGTDANVLIGRMKNVAVSNGSACTAASLEPSHVLTAMGLCDDDAFASIRFSLGRFNTEQEVKAVVEIIHTHIGFLRSHA